VEDPEFYGWVPLVNHITVIDVPGHHENIFHKGEIVTEMAEKIQNVLNENAYF
jgi:phosphoribosylaminoimidazole-succinocarboxamide synthase